MLISACLKKPRFCQIESNLVTIWRNQSYRIQSPSITKNMGHLAFWTFPWYVNTEVQSSSSRFPNHQGLDHRPGSKNVQRSGGSLNNLLGNTKTDHVLLRLKFIVVVLRVSPSHVCSWCHDVKHQFFLTWATVKLLCKLCRRCQERTVSDLRNGQDL